MQMNRIITFIAIIASFLCASCKSPDTTQRTRKADRFNWEGYKASLLYCLTNNTPAEYRVRIDYDPNEWDVLNISFRRDGKTVCNIRGHEKTTYQIRHDILIYADYDLHATGCTIVAYDLKREKTLWKTPLKAVDPEFHSEYFNKVIVEVDEDHVSILGRESYGCYSECLNRKDGTRISHKLFRGIDTDE